MSREIEFIDSWGNVHENFWPTPASLEIPDWYKKTSPYLSSEKYVDSRYNQSSNTLATVKKCMPFFDSITSGYIIKTTVDVNISYENNHHWFEWPNSDPLEPIGFHGTQQIQQYPGNENRESDYPKFVTPWIVKTPPGYSSLFVTPFHRDLPFKILEGIVDTDKYFNPIQFPFILNETKYSGLIPAGTPIAQILPFKRENWKINVRAKTEKDQQLMLKTSSRIASVFYGGYKKAFWTNKKYS